MKITKARLISVCVTTLVTGLIFTCMTHAEIDPATAAGMWLLDEGKEDKAKDSSGKEVDGTIMNGPTWVDGKLGKALQFDGTDDYVSIADNEEMSGGPGKKLTVVAWFNPAKVSGAQNSIVVKYLDAGNKDWGLLVADGNLKFGYESGGNNWETDSPLRGGTVVINTWHHGAFVLDGTNVKLYLDGEEVAAVTLPTETPNTTGSVEIGGTSYRGDIWRRLLQWCH